MLNEERVILMTRMACYENCEGSGNISIGNYFRSDYIGKEVLKAVICATISFGLCFALYLFYDFEGFMLNIYKMDLLQFVKNILILYAVVVVIYGVISYIIFSIRYKRAKKSLKKYYNNLRKLSGLYD
mgnify:CR=1 FL=1